MNAAPGYAAPANGDLHSPKSFPPADYDSDRRRDSIPSSMSMPNASGSSTGFTQPQPLFHRVPSSPPEGKKDTPEKVESCSSEQEQTSGAPPPSVGRALGPATTSKETTAIANVLLLAAAASKEGRVPEDGDEEDTETIGTNASGSSGPLKKRKTVVADILRQKPAAENDRHDPYHVSPMSHGSKTVVEAPDSEGTSRTPSYDSKEEGKTTPTHPKTSSSTSPKSTTQFPASQHGGLVPYFPSALHWLLTESSSQTATPAYAAARTVLQWVPHGQAFRVVKWDALRRQVLPRFFPQLAGSLDAFLWHLRAWGFEEIQDGPDVGCFGHTVSEQYCSWW